MSTKEKSEMNNREADAQNFDNHERLLGNWRSEAFLDGDHWSFRDVESPSVPTNPVPAGRQKS
jgi:hypothetical protein